MNTQTFITLFYTGHHHYHTYEQQQCGVSIYTPPGSPAQPDRMRRQQDSLIYGSGYISHRHLRCHATTGKYGILGI